MKSIISLAAALAAGVVLSTGAIAQDKPKLAFVVNASSTSGSSPRPA